MSAGEHAMCTHSCQGTASRNLELAGRQCELHHVFEVAAETCQIWPDRTFLCVLIRCPTRKFSALTLPGIYSPSESRRGAVL